MQNNRQLKLQLLDEVIKAFDEGTVSLDLFLQDEKYKEVWAVPQSYKQIKAKENVRLLNLSKCSLKEIVQFLKEYKNEQEKQ
ncbi:hypothetical protein GWK08_08815 [Leptobacterium flavescens]|uniref:Uncharacterized protein n=1 Tax=Leptobacterium flavescens TaxID=472055 RepID=A0A6P0UJQ5_9FLAO|nr:hypothetical protein [Leptobacterium flavescens]NER13535.1 hypothetical protein [Leptobacterium flavescens]